MNATDFIVTIRIVVNNAEWRHLKLVADNIIISVAHFMLKSSNENVEGRHELWVSNDVICFCFPLQVLIILKGLSHSTEYVFQS